MGLCTHIDIDSVQHVLWIDRCDGQIRPFGTYRALVLYSNFQGVFLCQTVSTKRLEVCRPIFRSEDQFRIIVL